MIYNNFKLLAPGDHGLFEDFCKYRPRPSESCEHSLANLLLYRNTYFWRWMVLENRLWIASLEQKYLLFPQGDFPAPEVRSEESELQSPPHNLVCRLLLGGTDVADHAERT